MKPPNLARSQGRASSALVLTGVLLTTLLTACQTDSDTQALGTLERDRIRLTATANEVVREIHVKEGDRVALGDALMQLDDRTQQAQLDQAKAEFANAKAYLLQLKNGARQEELASYRARVVSAEAQLLQRQKDHVRAVALVAKKMLGQADLDRALADRDAAQAALEDAREQLLLLEHGTRFEEIQQAEAQWRAAESQVVVMEKQLSDLAVIATRDGVIDSLPWNLGERVSVGTALVVLLADDAPFVRVYIPETKRASVAVGDVVSVSVDGVEGAFEGVFKRIQSDPAFTPYYALTEEDRSRLMYLAEVQLSREAADLPSGLPAQVFLP
ncbi:MAG: hypothetical protein CL693_19790 [Cellvibrionaceae bacterium]|nr:hypothetical protein [Cellvibrionaceae bacterium]